VTTPLPIAVWISGGGTTLGNLLELQRRSQLSIDVRCVVSSTHQARGLAIAEAADIPTRVLNPRDFGTAEAYSEAMFANARQAGAQLVVMAGFLKHVLIAADFRQRVTNIHPSLIPAFCGAGMYGRRVHQAVLDYGAKITGCTVHFVDDQYDHGPIILQRTCEVAADDTVDSLAARVFALECEAYPTALQAIAERRVEIHDRRVRFLFK
jgi:phosphoribosylglycinamide formyltransferase-1